MALAAAGVSAPVTAAAQAEADARSSDDRRAEELFLLGDSLYEQGRYEAAITTFQEAYRLSGRTLLLFNIANAQERAGRWADAIATLRRYREHAPPSEGEALESRIERLEERIEEREASSAATPVEVTPIGPPSARVPTPEESTEDEGGAPTLGLSLTLGGAALVLTGVALGIGSLVQRNEASSLCVNPGGGTLCPDEARGPLDRSRSLAIAADITVALGLVATALGVYFWVSDEGEASREVAFSPLRGGGALRFSGNF